VPELRRAGALPAASSRWRLVALVSGAAAVVISLGPPLDDRAEASLAGHMAQHVVLLVVAAPLLALGRPMATLGLRVPEAWRRRLPSLDGPERWLAVLAVAFVAQTAAMWGWHAPLLFDAADRHLPLHVFEHACLLGGAFVFWWAVLGAGSRARLGVGVLAVFLATLACNALGAAMTLANSPWYSTYATGTRAAALSDQQSAGVIMWAAATIVYIGAAAGLFFAWLADSETAGGAVPSRIVRPPARTPA
jgi:putative membrane protein